MKKIIAMVLALVLVAGLSIGGTVAYLQSTDSQLNTMTLGNVQIQQIEQERNANGEIVDFTQNKPAFPVVGSDTNRSSYTINGHSCVLFDNNNVLDKIVSVKNTGLSEAYVRTLILFECPDFDPNNYVKFNRDGGGQTWGPFIEVTIGGVNYVCMYSTYTEAVQPGATTRPSLKQMELMPSTDNTYCAKFGGTWEIVALSQAVQTAGFPDAATALNTAFGEVDATSVTEWFKTIVPVVVTTGEELQDAIDSGAGNIKLGGDIELDGGITIG